LSPILLAAATASDYLNVLPCWAYFGKQKTPTHSKRQQLLVDVPQSFIGYKPNLQIQEQGFSSLAGILQYTPGARLAG